MLPACVFIEYRVYGRAPRSEGSGSSDGTRAGIGTAGAYSVRDDPREAHSRVASLMVLKGVSEVLRGAAVVKARDAFMMH